MAWIIDALLGDACSRCGGSAIVPGSEAGLCPSCLEDFPWIEGELCGLCGRPLISERSLCLRCRVDPHIARRRSAFLYAGAGKSLMRAFKFERDLRALSFIAAGIRGSIPPEWAGRAIVPVPPAPARLKRRGWDPVMALAKGVDAAAVKALLVRCEGREQKGLGRSSRAENLRGSFSIRRGLAVPDACLILDDVSTTGATLRECARVLIDGGAREVACVTAALDL